MDRYWAGSTGRRNTFDHILFEKPVESLCRWLPARRFPGPRVQRIGSGIQFLGTVLAEVSTLGKVLAKQAAGVLVAATAPRALRVAKVDLEAGIDPQRCVLGHLGPLAPGQRATQAGRLLIVPAMVSRTAAAPWPARRCPGRIRGLFPRVLQRKGYGLWAPWPKAQDEWEAVHQNSETIGVRSERKRPRQQRLPRRTALPQSAARTGMDAHAAKRVADLARRICVASNAPTSDFLSSSTPPGSGCCDDRSNPPSSPARDGRRFCAPTISGIP